MTADIAYQFLKPSLESLTQKEKEELCKLIGGQPRLKKKKKKTDPVHSADYYEKQLLATVFKSRRT